MRMIPLLMVMCAASAMPARNVVSGTGNPDLDIPAVQAAVDRGGQIQLAGHFSFDRPPGRSSSANGGVAFLATVLVSKDVEIFGKLDAGGRMTSIDRGTWPFAIEARGSRVTMQGLRFIRPKGGAIQVSAVNGLTIADCRIEGIEPIEFMHLGRIGSGIQIRTSAGLPTPAEPGIPEDVSGSLSIVNNFIDAAGGTAQDKTLGVLILSVGKLPGKAVDLNIAGNQIRNVTERAINIRQLGGQANIERNVIDTGSIAGSAGGVAPDVIHAFGTGSYLITHNSIQSGWGTGAGIRVQGGFAEWPITGAIVVENDVTMSAPESAVFGTNSAAIEIRGFASNNTVRNNRIRGRARAALAVAARDVGFPKNNTLSWNDIEGFQPSLASVLVDAGVTGTTVIGRTLKIQDRGIDTVIAGGK